MLKYLIVQLDDTSVSFCHYNNDKTEPCLIDLDVLKKVLFWSMKENLIVQFLYPDYQLPTDYTTVISGIDHADIVSSTCEDEELLKESEVVIFDTWAAINYFPFSQNQAYVIRTSFADLFSNGAFLNTILPKVSRLNVVITDMQSFNSEVEKQYSLFLDNFNEKIYQEYKNNHSVQVNILTDRMMLDSMNNCNAGVESITLAPNGKFYVCPGFYTDNLAEIGDVETGLDIKNPQLYKLDYAPICKICDAWHCKRCVWLNKKTTMEVNTPSREQCVISHIERNASRKLLSQIRKIGTFRLDNEIPAIDYLDPFENIINKQYI